jgi:hypothetical protein
MKWRIMFERRFRMSLVALIFLSVLGTCSSQCPIKTDAGAVDTTQPVPKINPVTVSDQFITGKVLDKNGKFVPGTIQLCVGATSVAPQNVAVDGSFVAPAPELTAGEAIISQFTGSASGAKPGAEDDPVTVAAQGCTKSIATGSPSTISFTIDASGAYKGTVPGAKSGSVVICQNDQPVLAPAGAAGVGADGSFSGSGLKLVAGNEFAAEYSASPAGAPYSNSSAKIPISAGSLLIGKQAPASFSRVSPIGMAVAGLDISGASSTSPQAVFLATSIIDVPLIGPSRLNPGGKTDYTYDNTWWFSGFLRVTGMAQPGSLSANLGSLSSLGTYISPAVNATPDKIVQGLEADSTVAFQLGHWETQHSTFDVGNYQQIPGMSQPSTLFTMSVIASVGALTPLSASQANPPVYYLTQQIMNTYSLSPAGCSYTAGTTPPCYVSFVPTDRTHFYRNYDAGIRVKIYGGDYSDPQPQYRFPGIVDLTIGQNEYVTGGRLHGSVLHTGSALPVPTVDGLYIFGSMDLGMNFKSDEGNPQLILTPASSSANLTYLSSNVNTIPVSQPNRDRYRLGFGVDIFHIISSVKAKVANASTSKQ